MANMNQKQAHQEQDAQIQNQLKHIKNKILVMSGKGGVGKSSVAAYLSVGLAKRGFRVGLMDVDLHGPSIPRMLGLEGTIRVGAEGEKARPVAFLPNMEVMSMEPLLGEDKDVATIWRGPLKIGVIRQFIADIDWQDLDYMIIDSPPGTGDEPLTVAQTIPDAKALIVTTPQEISLADVRKSIDFCHKVNMSILGVVENMSGMICPHCGKSIDVFKTHGGMITAKKAGLRLIATLPLEPRVVQGGDVGNLDFLDEPELPFTREIGGMVDAVVEICQAPPQPVAETPVVPRETPEGVQVLAVPVSNGKLAAHFGHSERFVFLETKDGSIVQTREETPPAHEPGVLPQWIARQGAHVVIVGGMGSRAQDMLNDLGVEVVVGAPMDTPQSLAEQYLTGTLVTGGNVCDH